MSEGLNRAMLLGNIGADPELRFTQGGQGVLNLRLATTESYLDKDQVRKERTEWHNVVIWGKRGEALSKILVKGSSVMIEGGLRTSSYEKDGVKHYKTEIHATEVFLTGGKSGGGRESGDDRDDAPRERERGERDRGRDRDDRSRDRDDAPRERERRRY